MKNKRISIIFIVVITFLIMFGVANGKGQLQAFSSDIKLFLNGKKIDEEVITINGTSYLPVRVIGEALELKVEWDGDTRTINLFEDDGNVDGSAEEQPESDSELTYDEKIQERNHILKILSKYPLDKMWHENDYVVEYKESDGTVIHLFVKNKTSTSDYEAILKSSNISDDLYIYDVNGNVVYIRKDIEYYVRNNEVFAYEDMGNYTIVNNDYDEIDILNEAIEIYNRVK
ncbi:stalk domain-containing protein [Vallitalea okinawensis]|uniref:stalk domain-containing protein n=1 Tax=Vallitalea okinawensis TaxID=2078660 RepID=UPI000CFC75F1|nr:stalk domain-containing protein [Vallitalea okinawensis]